MVLSSFFTEGVLPFLLIFVVIFAILQKSKILGDGKSQIDSLIALAIALILIGAEGPRTIVVALMPWLSVGVAVMLVFLIMYGFVGGDLSGSNAPVWMKWVFGILAGIFTVGVVIYVTGFSSTIFSWFEGYGDSGWFMNGIVIILVIVAMVVAVRGGEGRH
jgi:hypothetical protein